MKRFTETLKWENRWFRTLPWEEKLLWLWLLDHCDNAGVIDPDLDLAAFQTGSGRVFDTLPDSLSDRVSALENGKLWIRGFIDFQYSGKLSPKCPAHKPVYRSIEANQIPYDGAACRVSDTLQDTLQDKEEDKVQTKDKAQSKDQARPSTRELAEKLVAACPRPDLTINAVAAAQKCLKRHHGAHEFADILKAVEASTQAVRQWPENERIAYTPEASNYFEQDMWRKAPESWQSRRQARKSATDPVRPTLHNAGSGRTFKVITLDDDPVMAPDGDSTPNENHEADSVRL